jgi:sulfide:quinone oxidoreductase
MVDQASGGASGGRQRYRIVIVGGGSAGISVAARLARRLGRTAGVAIIEPSESHYYQPAWTLVGGGTYRKEATRRAEAGLIPRHTTWIRDAVSRFLPEQNVVETVGGIQVEYDYLVVAAGLQLNWNRVQGLEEAMGKGGVCSNYSYETVGSTWESIRQFKGGTAIFTHPATPVKCGGAPQKIMYLADDAFLRQGVRAVSRVIFAIANPHIFHVEHYRGVLERVVRERGIEPLFLHDLVEVRAATKEAVFRRLDSDERVTLAYDLLHVTPPMGPPDVIRSSPLADAGGWVDVDKYSLQHLRYPNVFAIGDCSNLPTSKTAAAIRKQAPVLVENLLSLLKGDPLAARYDGYTSCPLVTGYGKMVLAEFDYDKQPQETFPFDQAKERWSMWLLKKYVLPALYWHGMLRGRF